LDEFSNAVAACAAQNYGHASREFLKSLSRDNRDRRAEWKAYIIA
jgi:hypothetical protein